MNKWIGTIRLTKDPEVKYTQDGKAVANFDGACNRKPDKDGNQVTDFFKFTAFGNTAEFVEKYAKKGIKFIVDAEIRNNNWTDKDNVKHYGTQFVVNSIEFCEKKSDSPTQDAPRLDSNGFVDIPDGNDEDMPFH